MRGPAVLARFITIRVHLVHKTHLDLGYTDFAANVERLYLERFIPDALRVARKLRETESPGRLCWTVPTYMLHRYLEQASPAETAAVEEAVAAGDLAWLALPFTLHVELATPALLREALTYAAELDARFGRRTIAAKATDVPGLSIGIVPILAEAGVELLYVGANGIDLAPEVPPAFRWRAPDGSELVVLHTQGYGGTVALDGVDDVLDMRFTLDNVGPPSEVDVLAAYLDARERRPGAEVRASTLDAFAEALRPHRETLPVVTAELGDPWLHGVGSDPLRIARYRELERALSELDAPKVALRAARRALLKVPEHTWGLDTMVQLTDTVTWRKDELAAARPSPRWRRFDESWAEQRAYVDEALAALPPAARARAEERLARVEPGPPPPVPPGGAHSLAAGRFEIAVDDRGAIVSLRDAATGVDWASAEAPLALFVYEVFDRREYEGFWEHGMNPVCRDLWWPHYACGKRGLEGLGQFARAWTPQLAESGVEGNRLVLRLRLPAEATEDFAGPRLVTTTIEAGEDEVALELSWHDKDAIRIPEAAWLSFLPACDRDSWRYRTLGLELDPLDVVANGGRQHAIDRARCSRDGAALELETLDAPLASLDRKILPPVDADARALHVNLLNTVWSTNFTQWYDDDGRFRFRLRPSQRATEGNRT
ncbi:MAG TPA: DUF5054 domain-containing protein [Gaiellaceae bacterium]|nr:DUF5054 domain-containing protein [Gaiellaceae bacterium]